MDGRDHQHGAGDRVDDGWAETRTRKARGGDQVGPTVHSGRQPGVKETKKQEIKHFTYVNGAIPHVVHTNGGIMM